MDSYDVIILGSGLAGSTVAAILAKDGYRVLMLEKGKHPRFALGEATLPQTSSGFRGLTRCSAVSLWATTSWSATPIQP